MPKSLILFLTVVTIAAFVVLSVHGQTRRGERREENSNCTAERRKSGNRTPIIFNREKVCRCGRNETDDGFMYCRAPRRLTTTATSTTTGVPTSAGSTSSSAAPTAPTTAATGTRPATTRNVRPSAPTTAATGTQPATTRNVRPTALPTSLSP